jgi:hypothetical protein
MQRVVRSACSRWLGPAVKHVQRVLCSAACGAQRMQSLAGSGTEARAACAASPVPQGAAVQPAC